MTGVQGRSWQRIERPSVRAGRVGGQYQVAGGPLTQDKLAGHLASGAFYELSAPTFARLHRPAKPVPTH